MFFKALLGCNDLTARAAFDIVYVANMLLECSFIDEVFRAQMAVAMPGTALMCLKTFANRESLLAGVAAARRGMHVPIMIAQGLLMNKIPIAFLAPEMDIPVMLVEILFALEMPLAHLAKAMERSALVLGQSLVISKGSTTGVAADPVAKYGRNLL
ncbi:MAG: hypothetical protein LQ344_005889 [Seirophora lacunosa]|nr:MAG: hypothetical protein LQ344_005889 [Seirophora lacunosa]